MELVTRCTQLLNVQNNMNAMQIEFCAENILDKMWMYSLEDIQLCLDRGVAGIYGTIYNRMDLSILNAWVSNFEQERDTHITALRTEEQQQNNIYEMFQHPQVLEAIQQAADKLKIEEAPAREAKRSEVSSFEQLLMAEYDALPIWDDNVRFSVYKNKPYLFNEYRKERYMEEINKQNEY
jgi:hypothetical protein